MKRLGDMQLPVNTNWLNLLPSNKSIWELYNNDNNNNSKTY